MAKKAEEKEVKVTPKKETKTTKTAKTVKKAVKKEVVKEEKKVTKKVEKKEIVKKIVKKVSEKVEVSEEPKKVDVALDGKVTLEQLFEAGAHFGHVVKKWNPKMKKYIWGSMNGVHVFDLEKTVVGLENANKALTEAVSAGKRVVIVGTKRQAKQMVEEMAIRVGIPFITQRWMGGLVTNWKQVRQTINRLNSLRSKKETGQLKKYTKKEQILFDKEISRLERMVGGLATLKDTPELIVVIDTHKEKLAVKEANTSGVKVIGLVDSNANPDVVDYVIPMNDDSVKGLEIVIAAFERAIEAGKKEYKKVA